MFLGGETLAHFVHDHGGRFVGVLKCGWDRCRFAVIDDLDGVARAEVHGCLAQLLALLEQVRCVTDVWRRSTQPVALQGPFVAQIQLARTDGATIGQDVS
jgi:hypothetical protein